MRARVASGPLKGVTAVHLASKLRSDLVLIAPVVDGRDELFRAFGRRLEEVGLVVSGDDVVERLLERERILSTGIGSGVAVPHAQVPGLGQLVMIASVHPDGLPYPSLDGRPVRLVFCLLGDASTSADHLAGLARLARLARRTDGLEDLVAASDGEEFLARLSRLEGL
jgi:mannitol/fructose-specific phosphotransferase system IIA component (Ntr-type)